MAAAAAALPTHVLFQSDAKLPSHEVTILARSSDHVKRTQRPIWTLNLLLREPRAAHPPPRAHVEIAHLWVE